MADTPFPPVSDRWGETYLTSRNNPGPRCPQCHVGPRCDDWPDGSQELDTDQTELPRWGCLSSRFNRSTFVLPVPGGVLVQVTAGATPSRSSDLVFVPDARVVYCEVDIGVLSLIPAGSNPPEGWRLEPALPGVPVPLTDGQVKHRARLRDDRIAEFAKLVAEQQAGAE